MTTGCTPMAGVYYAMHHDEYFRAAPLQLVYGVNGSAATAASAWQQMGSRPAAPYYAPSCTKREADCQTGASVVDVPPISKRPGGATLKVDAATRASPQRANASTNAKPPASTKDTKDGKKVGNFFARLFQKSGKGKSGKNKDKETDDSKVSKSRTADAIAQKHDAACCTTTSMSASCSTDMPPPASSSQRHDCQLPTFSAQFPPLEWLPDPRFYHMMAASGWLACQQQHQQQQAAAAAAAAAAERQHHVPSRFFAADELLQQCHGGAGRQRKHDQQRQRLTKCYSTSSECLQSLNEKQTLFERYAEAEIARRRSRSVRRPSQQQQQVAAAGGKTELQPPQPSGVVLRPQSTGDSALSTSPVQTDRSTGTSLNKYSSWSGSEANTESSVALPNVHDLILDDPINHTYINLDHRLSEIPVKERLQGQDVRPGADTQRTYENLLPQPADVSNMYDTLDGQHLAAAATARDSEATPRAAAQPRMLTKIAPTYISAV